MTPEPDSPVELRCSVLVARGDSVVLLHRPERGDWVLPGGRPRSHENMGSCARREVLEETGLDVHPNRCGLVLEVNDPITRRRIVELVFLAAQLNRPTDLVGEPGRVPQWVKVTDTRTLPLLPPIAGFLPDLVYRGDQVGRYVGNLWRPNRGAP